jgi:hypothetical protein
MKAIESRLIKRVTYPLLFIIGLISCLFIYFDFLAIKNSLNTVLTLDTFSGILLMTFIGFMYPIILAINKTGLKFNSDYLEINYLFGLIRTQHEYKGIKMNELKIQSTLVTIIQLENNEQIRLSEKGYENYNDIRTLLTKQLNQDGQLKWRRQIRKPNKIFILVGLCIVLFYSLTR